MPDLARHGIETEFVVDDDETGRVVKALTRQGLMAEFEDYDSSHRVRDYWKVTTDSSCGFELVSPILTEASAKSIMGAMRAVSDSGGYVTEQCGLHVHVELPDGRRTTETAIEVARYYHGVFEFLEPLLDASRIGGNSYCRWSNDEDTFIDEIVCETRYSAVNIEVLNRQPTIEFRQLQGTLDARLAHAWVHVCNAITERSLTGESADIDALRRQLMYRAPIDVYHALQRGGVAI